MGGQLHIDGRQIAELGLQRLQPDQTVDRVSLFRDDDGAITLLVVSLHGRHSAGDAPAPTAAVTTTTYLDLDELRAMFDSRWREGWWAVLEQAHGEDTRLYREWAPTKIERELHSAATSLINRDLATTTAYVGGRPLPAPGRQLPGWEAEAVTAMANHLRRLEWLVHPDDHDTGADPGDAYEVVGRLRLWRYGWEAIGVVRVDSCGEVFVRLAELEPRELTDDENEAAARLWEAQRFWMRLAAERIFGDADPPDSA